MPQNNIKAICFDLDGVLADMPRGHYIALNKGLDIFGLNIEPDAHIQIYNGLPTVEKLKKMGLPNALRDIIAYRKKDYTKEEVLKNCKPTHDKIMMLNQLQGKYKLACCSNATKESVVEMLDRLEVLHYFDLVLGNDEGVSPKPSPDIYLKAFEILDVLPEEVYILEDAPHGIESAKASGANVIEIKDIKEVNSNLFVKYNLI